MNFVLSAGMGAQIDEELRKFIAAEDGAENMPFFSFEAKSN